MGYRLIITKLDKMNSGPLVLPEQSAAPPSTASND